MISPPYPEIPKFEFEARLARAMELMSEEHLDGYLLFAEQNVSYFTGFRQTFDSPTVVWIAALVTRGGEVCVVTTHGISNIIDKTTWVADVRAFGGSEYWGLPKDPIAVVTDLVREKLPRRPRLGLELGFGMHLRLTVSEFDRVKTALSNADIRDASGLLWRQRAIKTPWELDVYRKLGDITSKGFVAGMNAAQAGVTEQDVLKKMWLTFVEEGAVDTPMRGQLMIRSGLDRHDMYCARPSNRVLAPGDQVMLDSGPCYRGYLADIQRHVFIGDPPDLEKQLYRQSRVGLEAAIKALRPGTTASQVYHAAQAAMVEVGVNNNVHWTFFGHSIGLVNHEPPFIVPDDHTPIQAGMVLSVEVPAYDVPDFRVLGAFLEDILIVHEDGCEILTAAAPYMAGMAE